MAKTSKIKRPNPNEAIDSDFLLEECSSTGPQEAIAKSPHKPQMHQFRQNFDGLEDGINAFGPTI